MQLLDLQLTPTGARPKKSSAPAKGSKKGIDFRSLLRRIQLGPSGAKVAVALFFTVCWLLVALSRSEVARDVTTLEGSSLAGLAASLQQGAISGRDFQSINGPGAQLLVWVATAFTATASAVNAYSMIVFFFCCASAMLIASMLLLCERITWKQAAIFYALSFSLTAFFDVFDIRTALLLLTAVFAYCTTAAESLAGRTVWATSTGILCFGSQLVAFDVGICVAFVVVGSLIAGSALTRNAARLLGIAVFIATLALANLAVAVFFKLTSSSYTLLFDYQNYALEILRGYHNSMGMAWELPMMQTAVLLAVALYTVGVCAATARKSDPLDASLFIGLALASVLWLASAFVRNDVVHVAGAFTPVIVVLSLVSIQEWGSLKRRIGWIAAAGSLILVWPSSHFSAPKDLVKIIRGQVRPSAAIRTLYRTPRRLDKELQASLVSPDRSDRQSVPLLAFPYDNYVGIEARRPFLAPVLESYAATTPALERYYIQALQRRQQETFDVVYGPERVDALPDHEQAITRNPIIFEYLYRHFELLSDEKHSNAQYVLRAAYQPRDPVIERLAYSTVQQLPDSGTLKLDSPSACGLVRVEMEIRYERNPAIFWPGRVEISLSNGDSTVWQGSIRPQEPTETFATYISPLPSDSFHSVFGRGPVQGIQWNKFQYHSAAVGSFGSRANRIQLNALECLDPQKFPQSVGGESFALAHSFTPSAGAIR